MSRRPTPEDIKDLRRRHHITQRQLAESLYDVKLQAVASWESGRRGCPGNVWWAMVLTHDHVDLWEEEHG